MPEHLFVYGTLRRQSGHPMARYLAEQARYIGEATVPGLLYDLGRFPGMVQAPHPTSRVIGDVYQLDESKETLRKLDHYENAESPLPSFFERGVAEAVFEDGSKLEVMVYWYRGVVDENQRIPSGDYTDFLTSLER